MSTNKSDVAALLGKGVVGAIPIIGPLAAEVVGTIIPNQRVDRIEAMLQLLESKLDGVEQEILKQKIMQPEYIDLVEDCFIQASRALSDERKDYIASLLKNSLSEEQVKYTQYKKLLTILSDLNDIEIIQLKSYGLYDDSDEYEEFWSTHEDVLTRPLVYMDSSEEDLDQEALFATYKRRLVALGLLKIRYKKPSRGQLPDFDEKTGMIKASGHDITQLGRLLLKSIDQLSSD
ncbi:hypothetical protein J0673_13780 [Vibrio sp. Vb2736]|uniref:hypothetical protein n=1 Tax=Vibrio sp. Vb2736 TaxID=2816075 RepID=UPI001A90CB38|nr:hypothetical protein [Vibrio sp. Vb2736]MBO0137372.1 hypothetical protein [Vibrio sp. Vb2736]